MTSPRAPVVRLRTLPTAALTAGERDEIRSIMDAAFAGDEHGGFSDDDWEHALGGIHVILDLDGTVVTHAAVVEREIHIGARACRAGYVEAVATLPARDGQGYGSRVMGAVNDHIAAGYELGVLGTGRHRFYERLGWQVWAGPAFVRRPAGLVRTPDEEGFLLVLPTSASPPFDGTEAISCEWRPGDVW
ncbi:MAG: GNAT family N-acetyltransferase [Candidatus Limnocylindrales bacterium]